jgi:tetratricopeptide (TPR) repeat protein
VGQKSRTRPAERSSRRWTRFFARASTDFYFGMRLDPRSIVPYHGLMNIAMNEPDHAMGRLLLDRGLKLQPYSFILRVAYMWSLLPRWGGSYAAMEEFAKESAPYAAKNQRIKALAGYEDWDRGRVLEEKKDYARAEAAFTRALEVGDASQFRFDRGDLYWRRDKYREALEDLNSALLKRPQDTRGLYERSKVAYHLGFHGSGDERTSMFTQAYDDAELSVALDPTDEYHQEHLEFIRQNLPAFAPPPRQH